MTNDSGPWGRNPPEPPGAHQPPPRRGRRLLWGLFIAALAGIVFALVRAFPGAVQSGDDWVAIVLRLGLVLLIAAGLFRAGRGQLAEHLRNAAIWTGIVAVLALGFAYRDELAGVGQRLQLAFNGGDPVQTSEHELVVPQDAEGMFLVIGEVDGQRVRFLVDTGATETVLSPADARRLGVDVDNIRYDYEAETANGVGYGAPYTAGRFEVGPIRLDDFRMTINKAPMSTSLLGRSFLSRLDSFEVRGGKLTLRWRDGADG